MKIERSPSVSKIKRLHTEVMKVLRTSLAHAIKIGDLLMNKRRADSR